MVGRFFTQILGGGKTSRTALTRKSCFGVARTRCACVLDLSCSSCNVVNEVPAWPLYERRCQIIEFRVSGIPVVAKSKRQSEPSRNFPVVVKIGPNVPVSP